MPDLFRLSHMCSLFMLIFGFNIQMLQAQTPAINFTQLGSGYDYHQGSYSLGWRFTTAASVSVTALGFYDDLKDGLAESHAVGIFDGDNCQLVTSATVSPSDPLTGFFRFHNITPVTLPAGQSYYIAAVTGSEKYAIALPSLDVHPSITFVGFSIYGQTQSTSSLLCPDGAQAPGFNGDFGPNFLISGPGENPGSGNKRGTAISLFCNRSGVGLNTAKCSATVADSEAPPRISPSGTVRFVASGGFFPGSGECLLSATQYSPGISSCEIQFAIPDGFPIGVSFPIEIAYDGNDTFEGSATAHELIKAGCVETPGSPCPSSIGLSFDDYPAIVKNKLAMYINCGSGTAALLGDPIIEKQQAGSEQGSCSVNGGFSLDLEKLLKEANQQDFEKMAVVIEAKEAKRDMLLQAIIEMSKLQQERFKILQETQDAIFGLQKDITNNRLKRKPDGSMNWDAYIQSSAPLVAVLPAATSGQKKRGGKVKKDRLDSETIEAVVKRSSQKLISLKAGKRLKKLFEVAKEAEIATLPLKLNLKLKQKGVRGAGTITKTFEAAIR